MSEIVAAYVTRDPEVVGAWKDISDAVHAYVAQTSAVLEAALVSSYRHYRDQGGWRPGKFRGLAIPQGEMPPKGWRMSARSEPLAVPDRRYKAGREIAAALDAIDHPGDPLFKLIGMPPDVISAGGYRSPAIRLLEDRTALYVGWPVDPVGRESFFTDKPAVIDLGRWTRIPVSTYYLAIEQADAVLAVSS